MNFLLSRSAHVHVHAAHVGQGQELLQGEARHVLGGERGAAWGGQGDKGLGDGLILRMARQREQRGQKTSKGALRRALRLDLDKPAEGRLVLGPGRRHAGQNGTPRPQGSMPAHHDTRVLPSPDRVVTAGGGVQHGQAAVLLLGVDRQAQGGQAVRPGQHAPLPARMAESTPGGTTSGVCLFGPCAGERGRLQMTGCHTQSIQWCGYWRVPTHAGHLAHGDKEHGDIAVLRGVANVDVGHGQVGDAWKQGGARQGAGAVGKRIRACVLTAMPGRAPASQASMAGQDAHRAGWASAADRGLAVCSPLTDRLQSMVPAAPSIIVNTPDAPSSIISVSSSGVGTWRGGEERRGARLGHTTCG